MEVQVLELDEKVRIKRWFKFTGIVAYGGRVRTEGKNAVHSRRSPNKTCWSEKICDQS